MIFLSYVAMHLCTHLRCLDSLAHFDLSTISSVRTHENEIVGIKVIHKEFAVTRPGR